MYFMSKALLIFLLLLTFSLTIKAQVPIRPFSQAEQSHLDSELNAVGIPITESGFDSLVWHFDHLMETTDDIDSAEYITGIRLFSTIETKGLLRKKEDYTILYYLFRYKFLDKAKAQLHAHRTRGSGISFSGIRLGGVWPDDRDMYSLKKQWCGHIFYYPGNNLKVMSPLHELSASFLSALRNDLRIGSNIDPLNIELNKPVDIFLADDTTINLSLLDCDGTSELKTYYKKTLVLESFYAANPNRDSGSYTIPEFRITGILVSNDNVVIPKKTGTWKYYNLNGVLEKQETYLNDTLIQTQRF